MSSSPRRVRAVLLCLFLGLVAGCGGGGAGGGAAGGAAGGGAGGGGAGGGGAGGGAGGGGGPAPSGAIYSGSEAEAALTPTNAGRFLQAAFGTADLAGTFIGYDVRAASGFARDDDSAAVSAAQGGSSALGAVLRLLQVPTPSPGRVKAGAEGVGALANVNENDTCDGRGGVFTTGDVDANGVGTVTLRFDNCADSLTGVTITGEVQFRILARNEPGGIVTRGEYTLRGLDVRGAGNVLVDGRIGIVADVAAQQRTFTLDVSWREEGVRPTIDYRGLVLTYVVPPVGDVRAPTISMRGRIYLADLGFATVRAEQAFIVARTGTEFPLAGGPLLFDGAGASRLEVTANVDEST